MCPPIRASEPQIFLSLSTVLIRTINYIYYFRSIVRTPQGTAIIV